jgi:hypothetical protein
MTPLRRWVLCVVIAGASMLVTACDEGGIGMGVSSSGARWGGGGGSGPGMIVGGGPVYR